MNTFNRPAEGKVSNKCCDPAQKRSTPNALPKGNPGKRIPRGLPLRFDDAVSKCVQRSAVTAFIDVNQGHEISWRRPAFSALKARIESEIMDFPVKNGGTLGELFQQKKRQLIIAIVAEPKFPPNAVDADTVELNALDLTPNCTLPLDTRWTYERWRVGRRKFCTPGRNWVHGPYLSVMICGEGLYSPNEIIRCRLWPVYWNASTNDWVIVRSGVERLIAEVCHNEGAVVFNPTHMAQLKLLQLGLGHRWSGHLGSLEYLPDQILMPMEYSLPGVNELYGIAKILAYDHSVIKKRVHYRDLESRLLIRYLEIDARRTGHAAADFVRSAMAVILNNPAECWVPR